MQPIKRLIDKVLKDKEMMRYLIIGISTTVLNYVVFALVGFIPGVNMLWSNFAAFVAAVIFAYVANKLYVFRSKTDSVKALATEFFNFVMMRVVSFAVEQSMMWLFVEVLGQNKYLWKLLINGIVVVLNYVFSKLFIFKKK